ncbi:MAG TPA: N-acyl homoserine lactonase family protein [Hyphomicrobiaceae bacterium]|nr:N-acyl homoserine lactonase family protein [Hyphomicrobiaceae bacterium]
MSKLPEYEIYAVRYATQKERSEGHIFIGGDHSTMLPGFDFFTYAIKGHDHTWIVDTGMTEVQAKRMGRDYQFLCRPSEGLAKIGIDAKSAIDVIMTHAHFDHTGTIEDYPNALFHIQDVEMEHVTGRDMTHPAFRLAYHQDDVKSLIDLLYAKRLTFHRGDVTLAPGLEFILIGGHARGQAILRVNTTRGWVILASDAVHLYEEIDAERPFAIFYDLFVMVEGYRRINSLAGRRDLIVPGHDQLVTAGYPAAGPGLENMVLRLDQEPKWKN